MAIKGEKFGRASWLDRRTACYTSRSTRSASLMPQRLAHGRNSRESPSWLSNQSTLANNSMVKGDSKPSIWVYSLVFVRITDLFSKLLIECSDPMTKLDSLDVRNRTTFSAAKLTLRGQLCKRLLHNLHVSDLLLGRSAVASSFPMDSLARAVGLYLATRKCN